MGWAVTASSTVFGINTRKYHGLLVAALHPPGDRTVCVSKLDEDVYVGDDVYRLGANEFNDAIYPQGYKFLKAFSIAPFPMYVYGFDGFEVKKRFSCPKTRTPSQSYTKFLTERF